MRLTAMLATLLMALLAGGTAMANAPVSDIRELSAICAQAFAAAGRVAQAEAREAEARDAEARDAEAGQVRADEAGAKPSPGGHDPIASPHAGADADPADSSTGSASSATTAALDDAVRACASVEDWLAAAELFPEAVGPDDAMVVLGARCDDPASGLGDYAACKSLIVALATPPPTIAPLPTPEVVDPGIEPVEVIEPARKPGGRGRVSSRFKVDIPGADRVRYFAIRGTSAPQLLRQNLRKARKHCRTHRAIACVDMRWTVDVVRQLDAGRCTIARAVTTLRATVYLPHWKNPAKADAAVRAWWRKVIKDSADHEARHIRIQRKHLAEYRKAVRGKSCRAASNVLQRIMRRADRAQAAFDRVEYQKPLPPLPRILLP